MQRSARYKTTKKIPLSCLIIIMMIFLLYLFIYFKSNAFEWTTRQIVHLTLELHLYIAFPFSLCCVFIVLSLFLQNCSNILLNFTYFISRFSLTKHKSKYSMKEIKKKQNLSWYWWENKCNTVCDCCYEQWVHTQIQ